MPNISSLLPVYANSEQEFVFRTFNVGNYDLLRHLPATIREQQVRAGRWRMQGDSTATRAAPPRCTSLPPHTPTSPTACPSLTPEPRPLPTSLPSPPHLR